MEELTLKEITENRIREIVREEILKFMQQPVIISTEAEASKMHKHDLKIGFTQEQADKINKKTEKELEKIREENDYYEMMDLMDGVE